MTAEARTVWVGVTVVPSLAKTHVDVFETEAQADRYVELAQAEAAKRDAVVWVNKDQAEVKPPEVPDDAE